MPRRHGYFGTPTYRCWGHMVGRCTCPTDQQYSEYGGRGITVCNEWVGIGGFERFLAHVGLRPGPEYSIDRIDNLGGYHPGNVRWATADIQARNRRNNIPITVDGITKCVAEWAIDLGVDAKAIYARLKYGWPGEAAVTTPIRATKPRKRNHVTT